MLLELSLVRHDVVVCAHEVLLELIVESLSRDLNADAENYVDVDDLLFECSIQDTQVAFARLFDWVVLLVLCSHDFVQVDLVVQKVVILQSSKRLEHLLDLATQVLDQCLILDAQTLFGETV